MCKELFLDLKAYRQMERQVKKAYPYEACGVMLGHENRVSDVYILENAEDKGSKHANFKADPLEICKAEKEAKEKGLSVTGFYHSHPDRAAGPSEKDREYMIPGMQYIILSVNENGVAGIRGYSRPDTDDVIESVDIEMTVHR